MQNTTDTQSGAADAGKSKFTRGIGKIFYYGLAIDSISRSINRAKTSFSRTGTGIFSLLKIIFSKSERLVASSIDDIETTLIASAYNIVASLIFTLLFLFISIFKDQGTFATITNFLICITFFIVLVSHCVVYLKARELIVTGDSLKSKKESI